VPVGSRVSDTGEAVAVSVSVAVGVAVARCVSGLRTSIEMPMQ
jgi:hypothetical protein